MHCRRCRRPVEPGAATCGYCGLNNPTAEQPDAAVPQEPDASPNRGKRTAVVATAAVSTVVLLAAVAGYFFYRTSAAAPSCWDVSVTTGSLETIWDSAVRDLPPATGPQVKKNNVLSLESIRSGQGDRLAQQRTCSATLVVRPNQTTASFITGYLTGRRLVTNDDLSDEDLSAGTAVLQETWHEAAQRVELPITYKVVTDDDGQKKGWAVEVDPGTVGRARALILLLALHDSVSVPPAR